MNQGRIRVKEKTFLRGQNRQQNLHRNPHPQRLVCRYQRLRSPIIRARPSTAPSYLSHLPATGGRASATPLTSSSPALPSFFNRIPDRNIGASGNLSHNTKNYRNRRVPVVLQSIMG